MELESSTLEYKREYTDDIKKAIIAFANTMGGQIHIGINDDLTVTGIERPDEVLLKITNMARDAIRPDITMFLDCKTVVMEGKFVVVVAVQRGTACPYYLASKGIRPEGVFVRQGASSASATEAAILHMIRETAGGNYEDVRSLEQALTFDACQKEFDQANLKLGPEQMRSLSFLGGDGLYSNMALLLSDQCAHSIKAAVFQGTSKEHFIDRFEFSGSLFKQLRECYDFINRYNRTRAEFDGLTRTDYRDYPETAVREALLNAIVHRDYGFSASILVSVFDNRLEIVTIGGLPKGFSQDDMMLGISVLRNKNLANIFYRLHLIEAYGTGVLKIMESYEGKACPPPLIETTDNAFKITLYSTNDVTAPTMFSAAEQTILQLFKTHDLLKRKDIEKALSISQPMAVNHLKALLEKGAISKVGQGKNTVYSFNPKH